jgi:hypothetical protein
MWARLDRNQALFPPLDTFCFDTEFSDRLYNRGFEGFGREGTGWCCGENRGSFAGKGLFGNVPVGSYTLVDGHAQPPQHHCDNPK